MDAHVAQRIIEIIAVELQVPVERVRAGMSLRKDLGMDSVAALNILFAAEEAFDVHVPEGELENVDDLDAILGLIERYETRGISPPTARGRG
jgi:acyl carrier protein